MSMAKAIIQIQQMNHDTVKSLEDKGYSLANSLKRSVKKKKDSSSAGEVKQTITVPGTTEHQRALAKASTHQGRHFKVIDGGAQMNTDDCMIALELREWDREKELLEKKKKVAYERSNIKKFASRHQMMRANGRETTTLQRFDLKIQVLKKRI